MSSYVMSRQRNLNIRRKGIFISLLAHSFPGTFIARVQDAVAQIPGQITYSLRNDKGWFEINNTTGVITVARTLDREVIILSS